MNTRHALRLAGHYVVVADANPYHLALAARDGVATGLELGPGWVRDRVVEYAIDLVIPQPDNLVLWCATHRDGLGAQVVLPRTQAVLLAQDKFEAGVLLARAGLKDHVLLVQDEQAVAEAAACWPHGFWLRARYGAGARRSTPCESAETARAWLAYWWSRDGGNRTDYVAERLLPGRDYSWASFWWDGELVAGFLRERLEYIYPHLAPSGRTGTPTVARVVEDPIIELTARQTVLALDPRPHGIYCVDLREDEDGHAHPTEVNAGRSCTTVGLWAEAGLNLHALLCDYAAGWHPEPGRIPVGTTLIRHIDCGHLIVREETT